MTKYKILAIIFVQAISMVAILTLAVIMVARCSPPEAQRVLIKLVELLPPDKFIPVYEIAISTFPDNKELFLYRLALAQIRLGHNEQAENNYRKILKYYEPQKKNPPLMPDKRSIQYSLGLLCLERKNIPEAGELLSEAAIGSHEYVFWKTYSWFLEEQGHEAEAEESQNKANEYQKPVGSLGGLYN